MKAILVLLTMLFLGNTCLAQPPSLKTKGTKAQVIDADDFRIITDTLYVNYDTAKVKIIITTGDGNEAYLTKVYGYVIYKNYTGRVFKENPILFFYDRKWKLLKLENVESFSPYNW